jgi:outer membrane protein
VFPLLWAKKVFQGDAVPKTKQWYSMMSKANIIIRAAALMVSLAVLTIPLYLHAAEVLTLEQAIEIAMQRNPFLVASRSEVDAAHARVTQAAASYYPQVSASAGYDHTWYDTNTGFFDTNDSVETYAAGLSVSQFIYDFGKTPAQVEKSSQGLESTQSNLQTVEKTLVKDVKQAYFEALKNQQLVNVGEEALNARKKHLEQSRALYKEGMRPKIDVTRGEVEVSQAELQSVIARYGLRRAFIALEKLLGGPPKSGAYVLAEENPSSQTPPELKTLIDLALEKRSELAGVRAQIKSAEADLVSVKRSAYPSLNAGGSYNYSGDDSPLDHELDHRWQMGVSLNWPLFTGYRQTAQVSESEANVKRLNALYENQILSVIEEVTQAYLTVNEAGETIKTAEIALRQAKENLDMAEGRYKTGVSDSIELSDAQVLYTESRSSFVQAMYEHHKALAGLEFSVGGQQTLHESTVKDGGR